MAPSSIRFFSLEFFEKLIENLNNDESLARVTKGMNTSLLISCDDLSTSYLIAIREEELSMRQASKSEPAEFVLSAPYREWEKVAKGEVKIQGEVLSGRVRFRGSMPKMLLYLNRVLGLESKVMKIINSMNLDFQSPTIPNR